MNTCEIKRQAVHFSGAMIGMVALYTEPRIIAMLCLISVFVMVFFSASMKGGMKASLGALGEVSEAALSKLERKHALPFEGAMMFLLGSGITLLLFPAYGYLAVIVLAVGDSFSTLIGVHLGRHKLLFNKQKSWEGFFSGFLAAALLCALFVPLNVAIIAAFSGMIAEALPLRINDNVSVPLFAAL